jgi:hypothetical protein
VVCHIVMMNGEASSMVSKKHTRIAPNTGCAESKTALDTSTDVIGLKKSAFQARNQQIKPSVLYQDNTAAIRI